MPHRSPLVAALERCGQLRARIVEADPTRTVTIGRVRDLDDALREVTRLAKMLAAIEHPAEHSDDGDDETFVAVGRGGDELGTTELVRKEPHPGLSRGGAVAVVGGVVLGGPGLLLVVGLTLGRPNEVPRASGAMASPAPRAAIVTAVSGAIDVKVAERCEITVTSASDHEGHCDVSVRCPRASETFHVYECPTEPLQFVANGFGIDAVKKTAAFETWHGGDRGVVDLALEP